MELNQTAQEMVAAFAKINKVSKAKTLEFAAQLMSTVPAAPATKRERQANAIMALRTSIQSNLTAVAQRTTHEIADSFGTNYDKAWEALRDLESLGLIKREGVREHAAGERGRRQSLWAPVEAAK